MHVAKTQSLLKKHYRDKVFQDLAVKIGMDCDKGHLKLTLSAYDPDDIIQIPVSRVTRELGIGSSGKPING